MPVRWRLPFLGIQESGGAGMPMGGGLLRAVMCFRGECRARTARKRNRPTCQGCGPCNHADRAAEAAGALTCHAGAVATDHQPIASQSGLMSAD